MRAELTAGLAAVEEALVGQPRPVVVA